MQNPFQAKSVTSIVARLHQRLLLQNGKSASTTADSVNSPPRVFSFPQDDRAAVSRTLIIPSLSPNILLLFSFSLPHCGFISAF